MKDYNWMNNKSTASSIGEEDDWIHAVMSPSEAETLRKRLLKVALQEINTISITLTMTCNTALATLEAYEKRQEENDPFASELIEQVIKNFMEATKYRLGEYSFDEEE